MDRATIYLDIPRTSEPLLLSPETARTIDSLTGAQASSLAYAVFFAAERRLDKINFNFS